MSQFGKKFASRLFQVLCVFCAAGLATVATSQKSQAAPITVPNFSFEASGMADGSFGAAPIPNWTIAGTFSAAGAYNSTNSEFSGTTGGPLPAPADAHHFGLANLTRSGVAGSQFVSFTSAASLATVQNSMQYTLTVALGNRLPGANDPDTVSIELLVNDVVVPSSTLTVLGSSVANNTFVNLTTSFSTAFLADPLAGGTLKVRLRHSTLAGSGVATADFDNVRLDATMIFPIPEPSGFSMLLLGLAGLRMRARRRS